MNKTIEQLVIDPERGWSFKDEDELYLFFEKDIEEIESIFEHYIGSSLDEGKETLEFTLDDPDEIWERTDFFKDERKVNLYLKSYGDKIEVVFCHCYEREPTFIYSYFSIELPCDLRDFQQGDLIRTVAQKETAKGALEGDSLADGDELALGLYQAMLTLRSPDDFLEEEFVDFEEVREASIEEADEVWRAMDSYGNHLVYFIKEYELEGIGEEFYYIVVTVEDEASESNVLLFSFPTKDLNLLERYRTGENLQAEKIIQEGSH